MSERNLPIFVLQHIRECALQHSRRSALEPHSMIAERRATPAGLDADQPHFLVFDELVESTNRIRPAANTSNHCAGQPSFLFQDLRFDFAAYAAMKISHHGR